MHGILTRLTPPIMKKYELPKRIITEITITNVSKNHEEGIGAILEYNGNQYGLVDWKTYEVSPVNSSGKESGSQMQIYFWLIIDIPETKQRYSKDIS